MLAYDDIHGAITTERKRGIPGLYITALLVMSIRYFLAIRVRASGNPEMVATPEWSGGAEDQKAAFCFLGALSAGGSDGAILFVESFGVNEYLRPLRAALEAAEAGVRVNAVAPSLAMHEHLAKVTPPGLLEELTAREAFGRAAEPWEVANVIVFLASDYASYLTGEVVSVSSQHP